MSRKAVAAKEPGAEIPADPELLPGYPPPRANPLLFGHDDPAQQFMAAFAAGRAHHAWLLAGEPGIGKATLAYHLARHVLSLPADSGAGGLAVPDESSALFRQIATLSHPGLFAVRRPWQASTGKFASIIPVEEIRRLKHFFETTAATPWRIVVIDRADDLNISSANALLKLLEEPPVRSLFFLISSHPAKLFATLRSRCVRLTLRPLSNADLNEAIVALNGADQTGHTAAGEFLWLAEGSVRRALELQSGPLAALADSLSKVLNGLPSPDPTAQFAFIDRAASNAETLTQALDLVDQMLTSLIRSGSGQTSASAPAQLTTASRLFSPPSLALWAETWERIIRVRDDAQRLNLDRAALLVTIVNDLRDTAWRTQKRQS